MPLAVKMWPTTRNMTLWQPDFWYPLSGEVHGLREVLESEDSEDEEETRETESLTRASRRAKHVIQKLFSFTALKTARPCPSLSLTRDTGDIARHVSLYKNLHKPIV